MIIEPDVAVVTGQAGLRALHVEARAELRLGHLQTAIDLLDNVLALDPSNRDAAQLRATASQQLHLAETYRRTHDAEDSHDWAVAASEYAAIFQLDPHYRDTAARRDSCVRMQRINAVSAQLDHHVADEESANVPETFDELTALDPDGAMSDTEFADRARLESAALRVRKRRRS